MIKFNKMVKKDRNLYESKMRCIRFTRPTWTFSGYHFLICLKLTFSVLNWINSQTRDRQFSRKLQNKMRNVSNYNYSGGREKFQLQ